MDGNKLRGNTWRTDAGMEGLPSFLVLHTAHPHRPILYSGDKHLAAPLPPSHIALCIAQQHAPVLASTTTAFSQTPPALLLTPLPPTHCLPPPCTLFKTRCLATPNLSRLTSGSLLPAAARQPHEGLRPWCMPFIAGVMPLHHGGYKATPLRCLPRMPSPPHHIFICRSCALTLSLAMVRAL